MIVCKAVKHLLTRATPPRGPEWPLDLIICRLIGRNEAATSMNGLVTCVALAGIELVSIGYRSSDRISIERSAGRG
jgi:hypothetical protein